jgi:formylglycine-generating enzyme required for sulfatase activity
MLRVVTVLLVLLIPFVAQAETRFALLIGNQGYSTSVGTLKNPFNDIAVVGGALSKQGFEVLPPIKDAKRSAMLGGVRDLVRRLNAAGAGAIGFIYYSGHGAAEKDTNINYLIPVDASAPGTTAFWDDSVKLDDVLRLLDGARSAAKFIVFDACRNELQLPTKDTSKGLVPVAEQQGMFIAYASAPGRTASDMGDKSGPYAAALAAELGRPGLDHLDLFQNVKEVVLASTGGAQQPWESNGLGRRIYLTGQPKPAPLPEVSEASREWARVDKTSVAALKAFERHYRGSPEADYAHWRIDSLKQQVPVVVPPQAASSPSESKPTPAIALIPLIPLQRCDVDGIEIAVGEKNERRCFKTGAGQSEYFKDCPDCPEMVVVPAGPFTMGSPTDEPQRIENEDQLPAVIAKPFAIGRFAVTRGEFAAFVAATGHKTDGACWTHTDTEWKKQADRNWSSPGFMQNDRHPVVCVNWDDAKAYAAWLSKKTGKTYRLPSEAEREYATRAGTTTPFWWGSAISPQQANYNGTADPYKGGGSKGEWRKATVPVDSFKANPWRLYNVHGNVWEWTEDCRNDKNAGNPGDGSARTSGDCSRRVVRGGSWPNYPYMLRSARRNWLATVRYHHQGFRVARTINP